MATNILEAFGVLFGITLGCLAEFWVAFGNIQIKYSHKLAVISPNPRPVYKRCRWWIGFIMYLLNSLFKFASYMFASLVIISPTSSLSIVINAALAYWYFRERLTFQGIIGSAFMMIGCVLSVVFGSHNNDSLTIDILYQNMYGLTFIFFTIAHIALCVIFLFIGACLVVLSTKKQKKKIIHENSYIFSQSTRQNTVQNTFSHSVQNTTVQNMDMSKSINDYIIFEEKEETDIGTDTSKSSVDELSTRQSSENFHITSVLHLPSRISFSFDHIPEKLAAAMPELDLTEDEKNEYAHVLSCVFLAFTTAGLVAWVQMLGKVAADLLWETIIHGNNQFISMAPFVIVGLISVGLCLELYLISEIMRLFDAVLVCPIYNSLFIFSSIAISAIFFNTFADYTLINIGLFTSGLLLIIWGMLLLMYGQTTSSLTHQTHDRKLSLMSKLSKTSQMISAHVMIN